MNSEALYELLKKANEPKGYFLNEDRQVTEFLLEGLLTNKARYGYMSCPCRMAHEEREKDLDIICPCPYREADVAEFGSCYCGLYVSKAWNEGSIDRVRVPERRPEEKC